MTTLNATLPQNKFDVARALAITEIGYPAIASVIPELLEWVKDYNWPVAQIIAPALANVGLPIASHIRLILETDDSMWKYWVLSKVVSASPPLLIELHDDITAIAARAPADEDEAEVRGVAMELLSKTNDLQEHPDR